MYAIERAMPGPRWLAAAAILLTGSGVARQPPHAARSGRAYTEVFYPSGRLRIQAYLYKPAGDGPFPLVVYNHGSRDGQDRVEQPAPFVGRVLTTAGYAVLVPERRGYGKSDGPILREEIGRDLGSVLLNRLQEEAGDVLAGIDALKADASIDVSRRAMIGWSFGGIVSLFATRRGGPFFAIVDQAGGSLTWNRSPALQSALRDAAANLRTPLLCMDAENDATTASVKAVCDAARAHGSQAELKIYPPFTPTQNASGVAPGHLIFTAQGVSIWARDVVAFLDAHRPQ
jgi:dienelactone hydrolase